MKTALITGIFGQDGAYLAKSLLRSGYRVYGGDLNTAPEYYSNLRYLKADEDVTAFRLDLTDGKSIMKILKKCRPDEVYNLAGQSSVSLSFKKPGLTKAINAAGVNKLLGAVRNECPDARIFQASSAEIYAGLKKRAIKETDKPRPISPYGESKLLAQKHLERYRNEYGLFACSGILFNHESPLRGLGFVTRKITRAAAAIKLGLSEKVVLGNIDARRDWGFAGDYVEAMRLMLALERPEDFVIATGKSHSVRDFVEASFGCAGMKLEWKGAGVKEKGLSPGTGRVLVEISEEFYRPADTGALVGTPLKAKKELGWEPATDFKTIAAMMVEEDLRSLRAEKR